MQYWLVKQEPDAYSWDDFLKDGRTSWEGIRSYAARLHLARMKRGDKVLFYHSVSDKSVVGLAKVVREGYPDPTADDGKEWIAVDLAPEKSLKKPVSLEMIKSQKELNDIYLIRQSRLSVMPLTPKEFSMILKLAGHSA